MMRESVEQRINRMWFAQWPISHQLDLIEESNIDSKIKNLVNEKVRQNQY